ncbi:NrfD/PsrC family molybdoenzyme membrane anchor subunit [Granulicoccus sp. GXG6511]|uniref:NrfD/PsrC family molybdoenzyme membrane anchor subunit n=1 Tax=Granulicoccus sp. GXG6511 TaxID=3381351 RepID=UPI003D7E84C3
MTAPGPSTQTSATRPLDSDRPPMPERRPGERRKRRGGGDPNATVPEAEFRSYYGQPVIQAPPWEWPIPAYLFLGGLAAGSGLVSAGAHFLGLEKLRTRGRWAAIVAVGAGGAALAGDLGRPERALNMMRTVKLTSPMSVGSWILAGFGAFAGVGVAIEAVRKWLPQDGGIGHHLVEFIDGVAAAGSAFFAPPLAAYTGVLLSDTALPTWHEAYRELPFIFVSSGIAAGSGLAMITTPASETAPARTLAVIGAAAELAAGEMMTKRLGELAEPYHEEPAKTLHKASKVLTVAGGVGAALLGRTRLGAVLSGAALMAGSVATRFAVFEAGMKSADDPKYTVKPQRARAAKAAAAGRGITQPGGEWPS